MSPRSARRTADAVYILAALLVVVSVRLLWSRHLTVQNKADWIFLIVSAVGAVVYLVIESTGASGTTVTGRVPARAMEASPA